jgi:tRNA A22 N-methylase
MFAQGKGERGQTSKPNNPTKGVRAKVVNGKVVGWTIPNSQTGKRTDKPLQWGVDNGLNPLDPKWVAMGAAAGLGGMTIWEILEGLSVLNEVGP